MKKILDFQLCLLYYILHVCTYLLIKISFTIKNPKKYTKRIKYVLNISCIIIIQNNLIQLNLNTFFKV